MIRRYLIMIPWLGRETFHLSHDEPPRWLGAKVPYPGAIPIADFSRDISLSDAVAVVEAMREAAPERMAAE